MIKTLFSRKADPGKDRAPSYEIPESVKPYQHEMNIADGGEFLDDAIRVRDQPFRKAIVKNDEFRERPWSLKIEH